MTLAPSFTDVPDHELSRSPPCACCGLISLRTIIGNSSLRRPGVFLLPCAERCSYAMAGSAPSKVQKVVAPSAVFSNFTISCHMRAEVQRPPRTSKSAPRPQSVRSRNRLRSTVFGRSRAVSAVRHKGTRSGPDRVGISHASYSASADGTARCQWRVFALRRASEFSDIVAVASSQLYRAEPAGTRLAAFAPYCSRRFLGRGGNVAPSGGRHG